MCLCGFQSHHPLTAALSFRISGARSSISVRWSRKICAVLHWIMVESREAHIVRVTSPYRKTEVCDSAFPVPVQFQASLTSLGGWAGPCSSITSATVFSSQTSSLTAHLTALFLSDLLVDLLSSSRPCVSLFSFSLLDLSAWSGTSWVTSYLALCMVCYCLPFLLFPSVI